MSKQPLIFEVSESSFEKYVISNSHRVPVIVEFMGMWSGPCIAVEEVFASLAKEFPEQFVFAKIDTEEEKGLLKRFKIENIPTLIVFKNGEAERIEVGELKEEEARILLKDFGIFHESDRIREEARQKHLSGDTPGAILLLTEAIKKDPGNVRVVMDMAQVLLDVGQTEQAVGLFSRLPDTAKQSEMGKALSGQLMFITQAEKIEPYEVLQEKLENDSNDHQARFDLSIHQISRYQNDEAVENLLYIIKHDADFKEGAARELLITLGDMITPVDPEYAKGIRRKMANMMAE